MEEYQTIPVALELEDGTIVNVEATVRGEQPVSDEIGSFKQVTDTIKGVAKEMLGVVEKAQPDKLAIKFSLEVAVESGQLTTLLV